MIFLENTCLATGNRQGEAVEEIAWFLPPQSSPHEALRLVARSICQLQGEQVFLCLRIIALEGNTAPSEEISQRWRAVGGTVPDLTGSRFEPQTSRSRDEHVIARPTGVGLNAR